LQKCHRDRDESGASWQQVLTWFQEERGAVGESGRRVDGD